MARMFTDGRVLTSRRFWLIPPQSLLAVCLIGVSPLKPLYAQEQKGSVDEFNLTLAGDSMIQTPASVRAGDPGFMGVVKALKQGDAVFTNNEQVYPSRKAYPAATSGNTYMAADPEMVKELQWMGYNMVAASNNHSLDYGIQGVLDTIDTFNKYGMVYAGIGETLGEARAPAYLSTPHGRVALIACTSTFLEAAPAGDPRPDLRGRPGLNPLHHGTIYNLDAESFEVFRKTRAGLNLGRGGDQNNASAETVTFPTIGDPADKYSPVTFKLSDKFSVVTKADPADLAGITHSIRDARLLANYVVTSIHAHEGPPGPNQGSTPAEFLVEFAHAAVDAGTDVFVSHGPLQLRGIEIYKGKVIFYSLGVITYQPAIVRFLPQDYYNRYGMGPDARPSEGMTVRNALLGEGGGSITDTLHESVVARVVFRNRRPVQVILTPVTLSAGAERADRGIPRLSDPEMAKLILEKLQKLSEPYGTKIEVNNGIGTINIPESPK